MLGIVVNRQLGFTLFEAMVVVTIIAVLTTLAVPSFQGSLIRSKVRKTADMITNVIVMSQSEALRRNIKIYVSLVGGDICTGAAPSGCEIHRETLIPGVTVTDPNLVLSPFYGAPSPAPATFTVSYSGVSKTVIINQMGMVSVEDTP